MGLSARTHSFLSYSGRKTKRTLLRPNSYKPSLPDILQLSEILLAASTLTSNPTSVRVYQRDWKNFTGNCYKREKKLIKKSHNSTYFTLALSA